MPPELYRKAMVSPPRPTLRSLAAEAGVSPMAVSLALRNSPEISAATRARLQRLAAARGYRPDPEMARLMRHLRTAAPARAPTNLCGLASRWTLPTPQAGFFLERMLGSLRRRAEELGYAFDLVYAEDYPGPQALQRVLLSRGCAGLFLLPLRQPRDLSGLLDWSRFSIVSVTATVTAPAVHQVTPNHFDNMMLACARLRAAGYRRIGLALTGEWERRVRHRWSGGIAWHNAHGGGQPVPPLISRGSGLGAGELLDWLRARRPDALISEAQDGAAVDEALRQLRPSVRPERVTLNWPDPAAALGVDQRVERIGTAAAEILAGLIARGERGLPEEPHSTQVSGVWRIRDGR